MDTNNLGTTRMIRAFAPVLAPDGRFLVVASDFGTLRGRQRKAGDHINIPSKVGQVAAARILARETRSNENDGRLIAAVCPGLTTPMPPARGSSSDPVEMKIKGFEERRRTNP